MTKSLKLIYRVTEENSILFGWGSDLNHIELSPSPFFSVDVSRTVLRLKSEGNLREIIIKSIEEYITAPLFRKSFWTPDGSSYEIYEYAISSPVKNGVFPSFFDGTSADSSNKKPSLFNRFFLIFRG